MPLIKRTIRVEGQEDKVETFHVPLSSRTIGEGVNNKTIYDLKKRGRAEVDMGSRKLIFEVVGHEKPQHDL